MESSVLVPAGGSVSDMLGVMGDQTHKPSGVDDARAPAQQRPMGDSGEIEAYLAAKDKSFYPSETVSKFCRHMSAAVEVTDQGIRAKRLRELWKELLTTASYKLLQQRRSDLWEALRGLVEPLVRVEDPSAKALPSAKERGYSEAIRLCGALRECDVARDYFYESMIMDARGLEVALQAAHRELLREARRGELLEAMATATNAAVIEVVLRQAGNVKGTLEMRAATRMAQLFHELDEAGMGRSAAELRASKLQAEQKELQERAVEMERQIGEDAATILDLRSRLGDTKRDRKAALEQAGETEARVEKERKLLQSVKESLAALERENDALKSEISLLKEDMAGAQQLHKEISRLEGEADAARDRQRRAEEETEKYQKEAARERDTRRRVDRHLLENDAKVEALKEEVKDLEGKVAAAEDREDLVKRDLAHEKTWRTEWNEVHNEVRDAVGRLYVADPPAVIDERSHQVMAMLQERIRSEQFLRSRVAELEDQVARESAERINYERRLAEAQQEMLDVRIKAAKAGAGGYGDDAADPLRFEAKAIAAEVRREGLPSLIPKAAAPRNGQGGGKGGAHNPKR